MRSSFVSLAAEHWGRGDEESSIHSTGMVSIQDPSPPPPPGPGPQWEHTYDADGRRDPEGGELPHLRLDSSPFQPRRGANNASWGWRPYPSPSPTSPPSRRIRKKLPKSAKERLFCVRAQGTEISNAGPWVYYLFTHGGGGELLK